MGNVQKSPSSIPLGNFDIFIEKNIDKFKKKLGFVNRKMMQDIQIKEIMYFAVKAKEKEIQDAITLKMKEMFTNLTTKKKILDLDATKKHTFSNYRTFFDPT